MDNDALVAALGPDAVAAVHGYRLAVLAEAERRGLRLVSDPLSGVATTPDGGCAVIDPIDIRLTFLHSRHRPDLAGTTLAWGPARGWSASHRTASGPLRSCAGPGAAPSDLVPSPQQVLDWASSDDRGAAAPPVGVELDDDPAVIRRLLGFADPQEDLPVPGAPVPAPDDERTGPHRGSGGRARASS